MKFLRKRLFRLGLSLILILAVILGTSIDIGPSVKGSNGIVSLSVNTAVAATPNEGPKPYRPPPQPIIKGEVVNPKPLAYTTTLTDSPTANTGGNWTNPTYAYASDTNYATQNSNGGYNTYGTYGNNVSAGNVITQVRVRADAFENNHASSQSKAITGNDANTGGFTFTGGASLWQSLEDASDATYDTGVTNGGGYCTVAFTAFTIPAGSVITNIALHYRHRSNTTGTAANSGTVLKVNGTYYGLGGTLNAYTDNGTTSEPANGSAIADRTYNWTKNPNTGATWTVADINGTGAAPLQFIGVGGSDFNPDVNFYKLDATVNYTSAPDDSIRLTVSWDGGTSWSANQSSTLTTSKATYWDNFTSATTWTRAKVNDSNFKVRVDSTTTGDIDTISLDWLPAEVTYDAIGAPTSFTSTSRTSGSIALSWAKGANADNTSVRYRTDAYPTGTGDGTSAYNGTGTSVNVTGLSAGQVYYFRAWSYNNTEAEYSSSYAQLTDYTLSGDPSNLASSGVGDNNIVYSWTKGTGGDKTLLRYKTGAFPSSTSDGTQAYFDTGTSTNVTGLIVGTTYYFRAWAYDSDSTYYSSGTSDNIQATTGIAWLSGYGYRKDLTIYGSTAGNQTDYQMTSLTVDTLDHYPLTSNGAYYPVNVPNVYPQAFYSEGADNRTYVSYQGGDPTNLSAYALYYDHVSHNWSSPTLVGTIGANKDIHYTPAIIANNSTVNSGKIIVFYGKPGSPMNYYWRVSSSGEDTSAWGGENTYGAIIYPKLVRDTSGNIYLFSNKVTTGFDSQTIWQYSKSTDGGASFPAPTSLIDLQGTVHYHAGYAYGAAYDSANGRIWFNLMVYDGGDSHYHNLYIFYFKTSDSKLYSANGTSMTDVANPVTWATLDTYARVYNGYDTFPSYIELASDGTPYSIYGVNSGGWTYHLVYWNGAAWTEIANPPQYSGDFQVVSSTDIRLYYAATSTINLYLYDGLTWSLGTTIMNDRSGLTAAVMQLVTNKSDMLIASDIDSGGTLSDLRLHIYPGTTYPTSGVVMLQGHGLSNLNDFRLTTNDGVTLQNYWIESTQGDDSKVRTKVPSIPASPSTVAVYAYYGKSDALSVSSLDDTFYSGSDDFETDNWTRWTTAQSQWSIQSGTKHDGTYAAYGQGAGSNTAFWKDSISQTGKLEHHFWVRPTTANAYSLYLLDVQTGGNYYVLTLGGQNAGHVQYYDTGYHEFSPALTYAANTWYEVTLIYDIPNHSYTLNWNGTTTAAVTSVLSTNPITEYEFICGSVAGTNVYVDSITVRRYANPEPTWGLQGAETPLVGLTNTPTSKVFGVVSESSTYYAKGTSPSNPVVDGDCTFTITNTGSVAINTKIKAIDFVGGDGWTLTSGSPGSGTVRLTVYYSGEDPASGVILTTSDQNFYLGLAVSSTIMWDFKMETGTFTDGVLKTSTITITAFSTS